ncbi:hypothetical protein GTY54_04510 [Streptomyces sp. SID625]|nr:hypothetical protein [Streptomyces sp. SID625]
MDKQTVIDEAARELLAHGGPACLTDPHVPLAAVERAFEAGATADEIAAEMRRQRTAQS